MRNPTLNEELFFSSNDKLVSFIQQNTQTKNAIIAEQKSRTRKQHKQNTVQMQTNHLKKYQNTEYHHQTNNSLHHYP